MDDADHMIPIPGREFDFRLWQLTQYQGAELRKTRDRWEVWLGGRLELLLVRHRGIYARCYKAPPIIPDVLPEPSRKPYK